MPPHLLGGKIPARHRASCRKELELFGALGRKRALAPDAANAARCQGLTYCDMLQLGHGPRQPGLHQAQQASACSWPINGNGWLGGWVVKMEASEASARSELQEASQGLQQTLRSRLRSLKRSATRPLRSEFGAEALLETPRRAAGPRKTATPFSALLLLTYSSYSLTFVSLRHGKD